MRILITILLLSAPFNAWAGSERCWLVSAEADTSIAAGAITTDAIDMSKGHRVDATKPIPSHLKIGLDLTDAGSGVSSLVLTFTAAEALAGTYRVVTEDAGSTAIVLSYDWDPSTNGKNWMIDAPWSSPFGKVTATPTGHGALDTLQMTIYGCTGDAPPRSPAITETGLVTADIDLDTGGYQLILDDGATGAGNGSRYYGQDTDLNWYRSAANTETLEGSLGVTLDLSVAGNSSFGGKYAAIAANVLILARTTSDEVGHTILYQLGDITLTGGTANVLYNVFAPEGTTIASGNIHPEVGTMRVNEPQITESSGSVTTAYTFRISDAPTEGDNNYALWVDNGIARFDGDITTPTASDWDLKDNDASALSFDAAGKAGILELSTVNVDEGVKMSGYLDVSGDLMAGGTFDLEGYGSIGNGVALSATRTLSVDRDFSTAGFGSQLTIGGQITVTGSTGNIYGLRVNLDGVILNDGGPNVHPIIASMYLEEPDITETVGTVTTAATVYIKDAPTEGDTNHALYVADGDIATAAATDWDLLDNNASALSFDAAGKAGILEIDTTDGAEGVKTSGYLNVTGRTDLAGVVHMAAYTYLHNQKLLFGAASSQGSIYNNTDQTPDTVFLGVNTTSRAVVVAETGDGGTQFGLPLQTHPTIGIQSVDASDPDEGLLLSYAGSISRTSAAAEDNHNLIYGSGTQTNAGDYASGDMTYCQTGDTTTDGVTGDCIAITGASGDGTGADAGGFVWKVNGTEEVMSIDGATGVLTLAQAPVFADYTRHHDTPIGAAIVGAAAPGVETIGTFRCYVFDANADLAYINVEVPTEWNGTSDMAIDLLVFTDQGDALGSGEIIEFDLVYRSVAVGEAYDNNAAVTINANVTGGASEVDKGQYNITATVDYDDTDQPLAVNDTLGFSIMRDVTTGDTYSGDVHVCRAQLVYTANALATH